MSPLQEDPDLPIIASPSGRLLTANSDNFPGRVALTEASKERIKLRANFLLGCALSVLTAGVLTPLITIAISSALGREQLYLAALLSIFCFVLTFVLYLKAEQTLLELDE